MEIYIDGEWHSRETARVSVFDHGLLYGDGVFEGIRVYSRRIFRLGDHIDRLYSSACALALTIPVERERMTALVCEAVRRNRREDGYIRLVVTRGAGELGIDPRSCPRPCVIIIATDIRVYSPEQYARGVSIITSATRQVSHEAFDPRVKSLNYLKNILAKIDAQSAGADEAIMLNQEGFVAECTVENLFVVRQGQLLTPSPHDGALEGVTRGAILRLAAESGVEARESRLTRYDIYTADECFLSGTGAELMSVSTADGRQIGNGKPGPITQSLTEAFGALVRREGDPVW